MYEYHRLPMDMVVIQKRHATGFILPGDEVYLTWKEAAEFLREMDKTIQQEVSDCGSSNGALIRQRIMAEYFIRG
jgi:hypothetical protein